MDRVAFVLLAVAACLLAPAGSGVAGQEPAPPRVILFIADGAGVGHWTVARLAREDLAVERMPVVGLVDTRGSTSRVTESAAGATALATGIRTYRGAIGMGPDSVPRRTVLEAAEERGLATGLVTNARLTDASPAAFAAHVLDRDLEAEIAEQMIAAGAEVLLGGGRDRFSPSLLAVVRRDYVFVETEDDLRAAARAGSGRPVVGLFADGTLYDAAAPVPSVPEMTRAALSLLDADPDGFFLVVETEATDTWAHDNEELAEITRAMLELDDALTAALEYRTRRPETLVVVVADHETGGMSVESSRRGEWRLDYTTSGHTLEMVPLFAVGPGAERLAGVIDNTRVGEILFEAVGAAPIWR